MLQRKYHNNYTRKLGAETAKVSQLQNNCRRQQSNNNFSRELQDRSNE
jgi:hypothetical protein